MRMRLSSRAALLLIGLVVLAASLWLLDYRAASGELVAQAQTTTMEAGQPESGELQPIQQITVYVPGEGALAEALRIEIASGLKDRAGISTVNVVASPPGDDDRPAMVIEVQESEVLWTPVYSRAAMVVRATYASDGDLSWRGHNPVVMGNGKGRQVRADTSLEVKDATYGLTSRPGYEKYLGSQIAYNLAERALGKHP